MPACLKGKIIGFIGAGRIGRPVIRALLDAGFSVAVYDKHKAAATDVIAQGATWAETPRHAAKDAITVMTCLARPEHVWDCMMGQGNALSGMSEGATWINMSTTDYHSSLKIAKAAEAKGIFSLEGPVSNISHMGVDFGNSSMYCAGDKAGYEAVQDILQAIVEISFFTGEIGTAQAVKLLTNLAFYGSVSICGDCLSISQSAGVPSHWMWEKIRGSKAASVAASQFTPMLLDGSYDTSCSLEIGIKDMALIIALADELGLDIPLGRVVNERYAHAGRMIDQHENHLSVIKLTEQVNGFEIRANGTEAPSKYGRNPHFEHSNAMDVDAYGRATPKIPAIYQPPSFQPTDQQHAIVCELLEFMAVTNEVLNAEASALGEKVGIQRSELHQMMIWSVGSNWALEHPEAVHRAFSPDTELSQILEKSTLDYFEDVLSVVQADHIDIHDKALR